ncbi:MAG: type II toxin-antitoxin system VapC family toxin [Runella slithyformis]|nr:MAG: type II toxin-antitoxin system VapC family toxin [Runella slithyformis]TAF29175.1 MAG: type II toxin-antitoxin system VapC family toxin [Runella slithyformis]TAF48100.1 MAG: type II toxin-antitoxin system VapC family toxin [Runella slithyformis]TAF82890.1 MAG: type II toxin-antitoxin system VapC family toxin [Runella slithyformis]
MRYLLDTQALIWFVENNLRLSLNAKNLIENAQNDIFVSHFSFVEIAIKQAVQKVFLQQGLDSLIEETRQQFIEVIAIKNTHLLAYANIPFLENHRDPFDRMIIATAVTEQLTLISTDEKMSWYPELINVEW